MRFMNRKKMQNPVFSEKYATLFTGQNFLSVFAWMAVFSTLCVLAFYPVDHFTSYLRFNRTPSLFAAVSVFSLFLIIVFTLISELKKSSKGIGMEEWLRLSRLPLLNIFAGKFLVTFIHRFCMVLCLMPYLLAGCYLSGVSPRDSLSVGFFLLVFALNFSMMIFFIELACIKKPALSDSLVIALTVLTLLFTTAAAPGINPFFLIVNMFTSQMAAPAFRHLMIFRLVELAAVSLLCFAVMYIQKRRFER
jgi:hypothetical protein